ncbi:ATP-dependent protease ATP-binding subunit ClpX [Yersinia rohdei]|uniref:ClpX C4-type zinc finger protein n=1 Tax=Yersinia rohdei TaxID=29485 RepID=UPI00061BE227|nr:ClpX C4-type zinc finger protein [Yersinia rohdei]CNF17102.1 ATP-dependent protease ATP-binding subunit ClpX [Yersinia rohdei]
MDTSGVNKKGNAVVFCHFCERPSDEVAMVIASKFSAICSDCVSTCVQTIADKANQSAKSKHEGAGITIEAERDVSRTVPAHCGSSFALTVNGAVLIGFNTHNAVAADYLNFIDGAIKAMLNDSDGLEKEANMSGRTIKHANFGTFGSLPIADPKGL